MNELTLDNGDVFKRVPFADAPSYCTETVLDTVEWFWIHETGYYFEELKDGKFYAMIMHESITAATVKEAAEWVERKSNGFEEM